MKIAFIKLGARIALGGTSGGSGEALSLINILLISKNIPLRVHFVVYSLFNSYWK